MGYTPYCNAPNAYLRLARTHTCRIRKEGRKADPAQCTSKACSCTCTVVSKMLGVKVSGMCNLYNFCFCVPLSARYRVDRRRRKRKFFRKGGSQLLTQAFYSPLYAPHQRVNGNLGLIMPVVGQCNQYYVK